MKVNSEQELLDLRNTSKRNENQKTQIEFVCTLCGKESNRRLFKNENRLICSRCLAKQTTKEKYGVENASQLKFVKEKKKQTTLKNFGVENPMQSKKVVESLKQNNLKNYGVENLMQLKDVAEKCTASRKQSFDSVQYKEKFQNIWSRKSKEEKEEIKSKRKQTCKERYGIENFNNREKFKKSLKEFYEEEKMSLEKLYGPVVSSMEIANNLGMDLSYINSVICNRCKVYGHYKNYVTQKDAEKVIQDLENNVGGISLEEKEIVDYLKRIYDGPIIENDRKVLGNKKELDIYLPEKKIAIEFNGIYWHSDKGGCHSRFEVPKEESKIYAKNRHLEKTNLCKEKGIRLVHIFEDDYIAKPQVVKSLLAQLVGNYNKRIFARKCEIKKIDNASYKEFLNNYHLQGYSPADLRLGLFHENELVEVMGIKSKGTHSKEPELVRLCTKSFYNVIGGFSKLLKHSEMNELVSYIDVGTFTGEGYEKTGFEFLKQNPPTFFYVNLSGKLPTRIPRTKFMKKYLKEKLKNYNENETEEVNMYKNGYAKIWNCGTIKVRWQK